MVGFAVNLIFASTITKGETAVGLILGAPAVPALVLCCVLPFCLESPRFYMRKDSRQYSPKKAFEILRKLRKCEVRLILFSIGPYLFILLCTHILFQLLAMKDMYVLHKTIEEEYNPPKSGLSPGQRSHKQEPPEQSSPEQGSQQTHITTNIGFGKKFVQLFRKRRLRNALISSSTVNLAQQLCGSKSKLCLESTPDEFILLASFLD